MVNACSTLRVIVPVLAAWSWKLYHQAQGKVALWACGISLALTLSTAQARPDESWTATQPSPEFMKQAWRMYLYQVSSHRRLSMPSALLNSPFYMQLSSAQLCIMNQHSKLFSRRHWEWCFKSGLLLLSRLAHRTYNVYHVVMPKLPFIHLNAQAKACTTLWSDSSTGRPNAV